MSRVLEAWHEVRGVVQGDVIGVEGAEVDLAFRQQELVEADVGDPANGSVDG